MNKIYVLLISAVIILTSCKTAVTENSNLPLNGKWILVNESGGIAGDINEVDTQIERHLIVFNKNNSVSFLYNDSLISATNFQIEKRESIYSTDEFDFIVYENSKEPEVITYLSNDTLVIADNNYDGFSRVYIKQ
ncbi:MAG: hypothetical protein OQK65_05055 [Chlorobium sp.]|nr:hypothetical protein [Chlorobium sp.]